jgi:hypothetical protein
MSPAEAPCGAADNTSHFGAVLSRCIAASSDTNSWSGYAGRSACRAALEPVEASAAIDW